jgi:hypothetical protein
VQAGKGLTSSLSAHCSVPEGQPGWLPDPSTASDNSIEEVLANLKYTSSFSQMNLTPQQISQILWAGYGCTAHTTTNGKAGLTVPSAFANYYLTRSIYLVNGDGVYRYHNRNPITNTATRDHRIEPLIAVSSGRGRSLSGGDASSADARVSLQSAVGGLPEAPCYAVLCLESSYVGQEYAQLETGFIAGNMLIQASALGLGCHFKSRLTAAEQKGIQAATAIPASHIPQAIVSIGPAGAKVSVSVALQGERRSDAAWIVPLTVRLFPPGANVLSDTPTHESESATIKLAAGSTVVCEIEGIAPGAYDITVFSESSLTNAKRGVVIAAPNTSLGMGTLLEGNANGDHIVDLDDCAILATSWLAYQTQPQYNVSTDFDRNGLIDASDLSLLAANWLEASPVEIQP